MLSTGTWGTLRTRKVALAGQLKIQEWNKVSVLLLLLLLLLFAFISDIFGGLGLVGMRAGGKECAFALAI